MMVDSLRKWLSGPECYKTLMQCAATVRRRAKALGFSARLFPFESDEELVNELWAFLASIDGRQEAELAAAAAEGSFSRLGFLAANGFISRLIDKQRTGGQSAWHAYYRHVRQVLSASKEISYKSIKSGAYYSLSEEMDLSIEPWSDRDYLRWPPPPVTLDNPKKSREILELALHFYDDAVKRSGIHQWVPIRELVSYIVARFPELQRGGEAQEQQMDGEETEGREKLQAESPAPEHLITRMDVKTLAASFAHKLDSRKRKIFYLHYGRNISGKELAQAIGYKGESGISYQISKIKHSLREFCMMWPGLSPEDLNDALFDEFITHLLDFCRSEG